MPQHFVGWMDSTIHRFLIDMDQPTSSAKYALVTCLDGSFDVAAMLRTSAALESWRGVAKVRGPSLLIPTQLLIQFERDRQVFHGFDEIWFLPSPNVTPKPKDACLVGPERLSPDAPLAPSLTKWLDRNKCSLGLGDGTGINFVARLQGVAKHLVRGMATATIDVEAVR